MGILNPKPPGLALIWESSVSASLVLAELSSLRSRRLEGSGPKISSVAIGSRVDGGGLVLNEDSPYKIQNTSPVSGTSIQSNRNTPYGDRSYACQQKPGSPDSTC